MRRHTLVRRRRRVRVGDVAEAVQGTVAQAFMNPTHPYTRGLVATARIDAVEPGQRLPTVEDFYPARGERWGSR